jgi:hypothetical protein
LANAQSRRPSWLPSDSDYAATHVQAKTNKGDDVAAKLYGQHVLQRAVALKRIKRVALCRAWYFESLRSRGATAHRFGFPVPHIALTVPLTVIEAVFTMDALTKKSSPANTLIKHLFIYLPLPTRLSFSCHFVCFPFTLQHGSMFSSHQDRRFHQRTLL